MKLPRGVSGERLVRFLQQLGYEVVRQRGRPVRLWHAGPPGHAALFGTAHNGLAAACALFWEPRTTAVRSEIAARRGVTVGFLAERL